nr:hypothetical protein CFP56_12508 [Quercus suber]
MCKPEMISAKCRSFHYRGLALGRDSKRNLLRLDKTLVATGSLVYQLDKERENMTEKRFQYRMSLILSTTASAIY